MKQIKRKRHLILIELILFLIMLTVSFLKYRLENDGDKAINAVKWRDLAASSAEVTAAELPAPTETYNLAVNASAGDVKLPDSAAGQDSSAGQHITSKATVSSSDSVTSEKVISDKKAGTAAASSKDQNSNKEKAKTKIIAIDAGHQSKGDYGKEPIGPGSKTLKTKVSSGTQGVSTGVPEYKLNLAVSVKLKKELEARGYKVVMIRETNNVNLSNIERADIANNSEADIFLRIHADGSDNHDTHGVSTLYPSNKNPYVASLSDASKALSKAVVDGICKSTGAKNNGAVKRDDMSGINWSEIPVTIVEMGFMSNPKEDKLMQTKAYQNKIVDGICDGIDKYFKDYSE